MDSKEATAKLDQIVGRALRDKEYREKLAKDPKGTLEKEGLSEADLDKVAGGALSRASGATTTSLYTNLKTTFSSSTLNPSTVMWSTDLTCNERG